MTVPPTAPDPNGPQHPSGPAGTAGPDTDAVRGPLPAGPALDGRGRLDPLGSVGGVRGIVEASLPTFVFLVASLITGQVWPAGAAALAVAVLVSLTAATAPSSRPRPEDRPVGTTLRPRRAGYALALAPVGAAGVVAHVMVGFLA